MVAVAVAVAVMVVVALCETEGQAPSDLGVRAPAAGSVRPASTVQSRPTCASAARCVHRSGPLALPETIRRLCVACMERKSAQASASATSGTGKEASAPQLLHLLA